MQEAVPVGEGADPRWVALGALLPIADQLQNDNSSVRTAGANAWINGQQANWNVIAPQFLARTFNHTTPAQVVANRDTIAAEIEARTSSE